MGEKVESIIVLLVAANFGLSRTTAVRTIWIYRNQRPPTFDAESKYQNNPIDKKLDDKFEEEVTKHGVAEDKSLPITTDVHNATEFNLEDKSLPTTTEVDNALEFNLEDKRLPTTTDVDNALEFNLEDKRLPTTTDVDNALEFNLEDKRLPTTTDVDNALEFNLEDKSLPTATEVVNALEFNLGDKRLPTTTDVDNALEFNLEDESLPTATDVAPKHQTASFIEMVITRICKFLNLNCTFIRKNQNDTEQSTFLRKNQNDTERSTESISSLSTLVGLKPLTLCALLFILFFVRICST